ncbi:sodium/solute symporter [Pseudonocardia bannensis]|uniref:Cation acetate symporter n=1 Tax=Pseudonocardia bannensis TaxID=630973 RepID=A0A848DM38_9PSEU|nr:cation acetate symporter [Pseudonocardia bannensis]NMH93788.1 cation acetate symporter [Pseudonocardia bannensis]
MSAVAIIPVVLATLLIGARGVAAMRSTSDFLVASRRISPTLNAAAVSGEYLSAASFLGVAGLVVKDGVGALWYPVGFTAGYLLMLTLVAAPMRRSGALTVPDFAEARLGSAVLRRFSATVVLVIACLYLVPQFTAAGQVLTLVSGSPYWVGVVVAGAAVSITLALGGMRAATYVQAFQFVLKLMLFIVPAIWLILQAGPDTRREALAPVAFTHFGQETDVDFRLGTRLAVVEPTAVRIDGGPAEVLVPGVYTVPGETRWSFPAGARVPEIRGAVVPGSGPWQRPLLDADSTGHPLLATLSVLAATALGTMGLPHVLVRFHTSPDGRSARRTAAITVFLLGTFYFFPAVYGLLGAVLLPELYLSGATDTVVVALPARVDPGWTGSLFTALLTAGAFAAFLATSLGLLLAVAGAVSHDLVPGTLRRLRLTAPVAAGVVVLLALPAARIDVGVLVTSAFAVAASTFCPLLVLGIWWPRLTLRGALIGMAAGFVASAGGMGAGLVAGLEPGLPSLLLAQPAIWSVPLAFATMMLVSLRGDPPPWAESAMLRLHLDETRVAGPRR